MKQRTLTLFSASLLAIAGNAAAAPPELSVTLDGSDAVLTWQSVPLNPGSATPLYHGYQVEQSSNLETWTNAGAPVPTRIGGGVQTHSVRVPVTGRNFFQLRYKVNLSGQSLAGSDFSGVDFSGANLDGANFSGTDLRGAELMDAEYDTLTLTSLGGPATRTARESVPRMRFRAEAESFTTDHPDLEGLPVSHTGLLIAFRPEATTAEVNAILAAHGGTIAGSLPCEDPATPAPLLVRFPTQNHTALLGVLASLNNEPLVARTAQDVMLAGDAIPRQETEWSEWPWTAGSDPPLGNWGLRAAKVPQMWNFNKKLRQMIGEGQRPPRAAVAVLDLGFFLPASEFDSPVLVSPLKSGGHGAHVSGIIGARFSFADEANGGVDGINPFAQLYVADSTLFDGDAAPPAPPPVDPADIRVPLSNVVSEMHALASRLPVQKAAMNLSVGHGWHKKKDDPATVVVEDYSRDPMTDPVAQAVVISGAYFFQVVRSLNAGLGKDILYCTSAGNSSNYPDRRTPLGLIDAQWNSPWNYAALVLGEPGVIVVEATGDEAGTPYINGCVNGHIRAPGVDVFSTVWPNANNGGVTHTRLTGTSMAAPHVTGVVSYLWMLEPSLTGAQIQAILRREGGSAPNSPRLNAFYAAMEIDFEKNSDLILKILTDVDDETRDGNTRIERYTDPDNPAGREVVSKAPRPEGDGIVDIKDFRTWRDWVLQSEHGATSTEAPLDGDSDHPWKDLNGDGLVQSRTRESVFPRGDFNGDGVMSRAATNFVSGVMNRQATDLEVLQKLMVPDEWWAKSSLPNLIDSYDVHLSLYYIHLHNLLNPESRIVTLRMTLVSGDPGFNAGKYPVEVTVPFRLPTDPDSKRAELTLTLTSLGPDFRERFVFTGLTEEGDEVGIEDLRITETRPGADFLLEPKIATE